MSGATRGEGWGAPLNAAKWHFFREGRSLCSRWAYFADALDPDNNDHPDNCRECQRKRLRELAKEQP